jgi:hypothetical protein
MREEDSMEKARVIQWTTGKVGKLSLRGIFDDPRLELVGVYAYSGDKVGKDAGALCGRPDCGIKATNDIDALIALGADTVIYTPFMADIDHVKKLLESGIDVISTNLLANVGGVRGDVKKEIEVACKRGGSSLLITGISPGWINAMTAAATAICRDVQSVSISEAADCSVYESRETWLALGISLPEVTPEVRQMAQMALMSFYDAVQRMAEALGYELDDAEFFLEYATASERVDLGYMVIERGTHGALRGGWNGKVKGRTVVQMKVSWFLTTKLNEDWVLPDNQYHVVVKGEPDVDFKIQFIPPKHWHRHEWDTMTAMPAVNAVFDVKAAAPGVLALKDAGLVRAPAGIWLKD